MSLKNQTGRYIFERTKKGPATLNQTLAVLAKMGETDFYLPVKARQTAKGLKFLDKRSCATAFKAWLVHNNFVKGGDISRGFKTWADYGNAGPGECLKPFTVTMDVEIINTGKRYSKKQYFEEWSSFHLDPNP